jgi:predicted amidohydrolase
MKLKAGLIQTCASDQPKGNLKTVLEMIREAYSLGAEFILTPEVTNCVSLDRDHQRQALCHQEEDPSLLAYQEIASELSIWLLIGSLAIKTHDPDGRFANRSFMLGPDGTIIAQYDKIHMFDVALSETETFQESKGYRPGDEAVLATCGFANVGLSICYDVRFPQLYRDLAQAGAQIITVPAAFSPISGAAHWHTLLRARAIETGCYILAPAQAGQHDASIGDKRQTYGHSLAVNPWGEIIADASTDIGITIVEIDLEEVETAHKRIPSLQHDREYQKPKCLEQHQKTH